MANFPMRAAHGRHRVVASDEPRHSRIDLSVILVFVWDQLLLQKVIKVGQLARYLRRGYHRETVGRGANTLEYGPELVVFGLESGELRWRERRAPLSRPFDVKRPQGVQNNGNVYRFLKNGSGQWWQITERRGGHRKDRQTHTTDDALYCDGARAMGDAERFGKAVQPIYE